MQSSNTSKSNSRSAHSALLVITLTSLLLGACSHQAPLREPVTRTIPGPPSYLKPEPIPGKVDSKGKGKSPFIVAEERGQVIGRQNTVIVAARDAWTKMKQTYSESLLKRNIFGR